jgi:hypothetical protein
MRRYSIKWMAFAVLSVALFGGARLGVAPVHTTQMVAVTGATSEVPESGALEVASIASRVSISPAALDLTPDAAEPPVAPDSSVATPAQPAQVAATSREAPQASPVTANSAPPSTATCPINYFCYPRVSIVGPIVPYGDCTASTDVGTAIRSLTCVSPTYLAAHAYTQFGRISGWRPGDIVVANGVRYVLFDAFTQPSCAVPSRALAPLSLQTSLTSTTCGMVLVVQGRPE